MKYKHWNEYQDDKNQQSSTNADYKLRCQRPTIQTSGPIQYIWVFQGWSVISPNSAWFLTTENNIGL